ncbi:putative zinc finger protein 56, partial [Apodemus sylvaticus]|uniref:putative zinc finger protein 56 n=1 Tax=Apodemus sylvaticus TaxID=10129 RepID=UPI0022422596
MTDRDSKPFLPAGALKWFRLARGFAPAPKLLGKSNAPEELVSFEDVTVKFTWEEWQNLNNAQKMLYRSVMLEMYSSRLSLAFYQKSDLSRHQRIHNSEKLHEYKECRKDFQNKSYLKTHQKVHTDEKPYECKECGKAFQNKSYLNNHQIIHTGEKPYEYNKCGKTFQWKLVLSKHHRIHTDEKPYECIQCGKMLGYKSSLIVYELIHSGEKPYG